MAEYSLVGAKFVPSFANPVEWNSNNAYDELTVVMHNGSSYTSRQYVPVGTEITDKNYWVCTGNYNAQYESVKNQLEGTADSGLKKLIDGNIKNLGYMKYYATPEMFGAVGDGVTDDTSAIQAAIDSSSVLVASDHTYKITSTLKTTTEKMLKFNNAVLLADGITAIEVSTTNSNIHTRYTISGSLEIKNASIGIKQVGDTSNTNAEQTQIISGVLFTQCDTGIYVDTVSAYGMIYDNLRFATCGIGFDWNGTYTNSGERIIFRDLMTGNCKVIMKIESSCFLDIFGSSFDYSGLGILQTNSNSRLTVQMIGCHIEGLGAKGRPHDTYTGLAYFSNNFSSVMLNNCYILPPSEKESNYEFIHGTNAMFSTNQCYFFEDISAGGNYIAMCDCIGTHISPTFMSASKLITTKSCQNIVNGFANIASSYGFDSATIPSNGKLTFDTDGNAVFSNSGTSEIEFSFVQTIKGYIPKPTAQFAAPYKGSGYITMSLVQQNYKSDNVNTTYYATSSAATTNSDYAMSTANNIFRVPIINNIIQCNICVHIHVSANSSVTIPRLYLYNF